MAFTLPVLPGVNLRHKRIDVATAKYSIATVFNNNNNKKIKTGIMRQLFAHVQASSRDALLFSRKKKKTMKGGREGGRRCPLSVLTRFLFSLPWFPFRFSGLSKSLEQANFR